MAIESSLEEQKASTAPHPEEEIHRPSSKEPSITQGQPQVESDHTNEDEAGEEIPLNLPLGLVSGMITGGNFEPINDFPMKSPRNPAET